MVRGSMLCAFALASLLLVGCQSLSGIDESESDEDDALRTEAVVASAEESGCQGDTCARVDANYLRFPASPALSDELEHRLFGLAGGISDDAEGNALSRARSFGEFDERLFEASREGQGRVAGVPSYAANLEAEVIADNDRALVVELDGYLFSGGAHGMPLTEYMVIDRDTQRVVGLDDMLEPGQRPAFEAALVRAHQRWLESDAGAGLGKSAWPLSSSDNVAPLSQGLTVKYQVYDIAPYAVGQPTLTIPYTELEGVLRPRYRP